MAHDMDHGIKISNSAVEGTKKPVSRDSREFLPHVLYSLALPYLYGAKTQIERYEAAAGTLQTSPISGVQKCLHETSCLFEDLATVSKYVEMCGETNKHHSLWFDIRNHIRHDTREEFDNLDDRRKKERAERLMISNGFQTSLGFDMNTIKVGDLSVNLEDIANYIEWAESVIQQVMDAAIEQGMIKIE